jgi:hypothetical protein
MAACLRWLAAPATLACGIFVTACASPPPTAPSASQVAGAWIANATLLSASGGDCVGADLSQASGRRDQMLIALSGESAINATITAQGNGTSCAYAGSNAGGSLNLTMTTCQQSRVLNVLCSSGARRDLQLTGGSVQASLDSRTGTGAGLETTAWNVFVAGSTQSVGLLSVQSTFAWIFLGLPSSDYHTFTGTVFPGYADGTISIPADANAWCQPCGWFH